MHETKSLAESLALLPENEQQEILESLSESEALSLLYDWLFWARSNQIAPPGEWAVWLLLAGRGFGKTRTGAEEVRRRVESGNAKRIALVSPTAADGRDVMVEGDSGILAVCPPWNRPIYEPSKRRLTWTNGAIATIYSADKPSRLRGPQHDFAWCDELGFWRYSEAWDNLLFGLRLGLTPQCVVTTTPKRVKHLVDLVSDPSTVITRGSTFENIANLAPNFIKQISRKYEGTTLGRQELYAELLGDVEGALWTIAMIEAARTVKVPDLSRIVVAIDPATTATEGSDETGIVVAGKDDFGEAYVLDDVSLKGSPDQWAKAAVAAFHKYKADRIIAEANNGGDMVEHVIRTVDRYIPYKAVHAARGKRARAEPVAALYEQKRVHHVGCFALLEDQLTTFVPGEGDSPDRHDALVWAITELLIGINEPRIRRI